MIDGDLYEERNVVYGDKVEVSEPEAREGYTFSGWGEIPETMPAQDIEITGEYIVNLYKLTVYIGDEVYMEEMLPYGSYIDIPDPEAPEGMIFEGWQEAIPETMPAYDLVITGSFGIETGLDSVDNDEEETLTVYTVNGMLICKDVPAYEVKGKLQSGLYIINGKKVLVK